MAYDKNFQLDERNNFVIRHFYCTDCTSVACTSVLAPALASASTAAACPLNAAIINAVVPFYIQYGHGTERGEGSEVRDGEVGWRY